MKGRDEMRVLEIVMEQMRHLPEVPKEFGCPICKHKTLSVRLGEKVTRYAQFAIEPSRVQCVVCGNTFERRDAWENVSKLTER